MDAGNTFDAPEAVAPEPVTYKITDGELNMLLPPKSIVVVALQ